MEETNTTRKFSEYAIAAGVIGLLTVFPLVTRDMYFDILQFRYQVFCGISLTAIAATLICSMIERRKAGRVSAEKIKGISVCEKCILAFWFLCGVSTMLSDYQYESFWGNEGRLCGFFFLTIAVLLYITIERKLRFKNWMVDLFLISAVAACCWGITDFFKMDLFGFKENISHDDYKIFVSSIGNVNTYTSYVALAAGISSVLFISAEKAAATIWYGACMSVSFFAIIVGQSDNAYLALGALFAFLPYYAFRSMKRLARYVVMLALFFSVIQLISWICTAFKDSIQEFTGIFNVISEISLFKALLIALWVAAAAAIFWSKKFTGEEHAAVRRNIWSVFLLLAAAGLIALLYDANTTQNPEKYASLGSYLIFTDDWGTHRMYNWRLGLRHYKDFSLLHKIFGYGPETYGIVLVTNSYNEMIQAFGEKYDNAHNEYLQYFITIGPVGLLAYLSVWIVSIREMIKKAADDPYVIAMVFALICYGAQATVNIAVPMVYPFVWIFLAMGVAASRNRQ